MPDEFLARADDIMMVMNTAPRGDLEVDDWTVTPEMIRAWEGMTTEAGEVRFLMAAEDTRTGELAGYTEVFWSPERAALVFPGATTVRPVTRGQGLGKWLRAVGELYGGAGPADLRRAALSRGHVLRAVA